MSDVVKFFALGGQDENGKSMYIFEINQKIFIVDAGFKFPEGNNLGIDIIIPSYDYLVENKERISAIIITHGHDDVMLGLAYLLEEINRPIYAPTLTSYLIEEMVKKHNRNNRTKLKPKIYRVKRNSKIKIDGVEVVFFPLTHSIPGSVGIAFGTDQGYVVYSGEFIIDFGAPVGFQSNLQSMMEIGKKGVLALLAESSYATKDGYTAPKHKLTSKIEPIFEEAEGRIIIASYAQNIFRIQEIIELTKKYNRKIVFYGKDMYDNTNTLFRIGKTSSNSIFNITSDDIAEGSCVGNPAYDDQLVVLLTGGPKRIYHDICDIIDGGDERLKITSTDSFIVGSPVLPGTEKIAMKAQNDLYITDAKIYLLKNKDLTSMHASIEDLKVLIQMFKPKYYIPIKGEYQHFIANAKVAGSSGINPENILLLDNGEKITFKDGELTKEKVIIDIEDVMIDGIGVGDVGVKVIDDRIQLSRDGVVIIGITVDSKTREIISQIDIQTRGFVYLKDSESIIAELMSITEEEIKFAKENMETDLNDIRMNIRDRSIKYITKSIAKRPVVLPIIVEV